MKNIAPPPANVVTTAIENALAEDLGTAGDITSASTIGINSTSIALIRARTSGNVAGVKIAARVFRYVEPSLDITEFASDGDEVAADDTLLKICGNTRSILMSERVALNFLSHLSGIATATAELVAEIAGTQAKVVCTRKTTPGLRALEKFAVRCGGGVNHRFGLHDAIMIKDNHIAASGSIIHALKSAREHVGHMVKVEIEIDNLDQLEEAIAGNADIVMLDNMSPADMSEAVKITNGRVILEASGNVTKTAIRSIAETGVDFISSGWITHSAPILDLGLDFE